MTGIEKKLESFLIDFEREAYEVGAGLKDDSDFTAIYERYPALFTRESAEAAYLEIPLIRGRDSVVAFITVNIIDNALREDTDRLLTEELKAEITVDGRKVPYRQAQLLISNEPRPERRRDLDAARFAVLRRLNPMYADLHKRSHDMAKEMGYENYVDFFQKLEGINLGALREHTEKFLAATGGIYASLLDEYRTGFLKIPANEIAQCDMTYMRRATRFDGMFPAAALTGSAWKTLAAMGIDAEHHPHIRLDIEYRDKKSPRAFCSPVRVPDEVYLVIMPHGGADDYNSFLHELGHTLHYAFTDPGQSLAARFLGDNSVTEAHAMTIEYLCCCREWLEFALDATDTKEYLRFMDFFELYMLRRYCAKFHYEMELHTGGSQLEEYARLYARTLTRATRVSYPQDDYLRDVDPHFYCARYLRAWMLRRQIAQALEERYGTKWFTAKGAGDMLRDLWAAGQANNAESVSSQAGFKTLDMDALIEHYQKRY